MMKRRNKAHMVAKIDITPFTDVVLVLLIIFMVATPLISQGKIKVNLPDANASKTNEKPDSIKILVGEDGMAYIDETGYSLPGEEAKFREGFLRKLATVNDPTIIINGDKNVKYDYIVNIVNVMSDLKVRKIMLGTNMKRS
jgi:biopolymer transport protein TolR